MEIIPSARGSLIVEDGYLYRKEKKLHGQLRYLTCANKTCKARAMLERGHVVMKAAHNHPPEEVMRDRLEFKAALKDACIISPYKKPRKIFQDVCKRFPRLASSVTFESSKSQIYRYREYGRAFVHSFADKKDDENQETSDHELDSGIASSLDFNAMASSLLKARVSANFSEVGVQESAGPSNIESRPSSSRSNAQFAASEITSLQDSALASLVESEDIVLTPLEDGALDFGESVAEEQGNTEEEMEPERNSSGGETHTIENNTIVSEDFTLVDFVDVTQPLGNTCVEVIQPSVNESFDVAQPSVNTCVEVTHSSVNESAVTQTSLNESVDVTKPLVSNSVDVTQPSVNESVDLTKPLVSESVDVTQPRENKSDEVTQPSATNPYITPGRSAKTQDKRSKTSMLDYDAKKLDSVIERLEYVSNKFIAASLVDKYDQFGKYISLLLRGLPTRKVTYIKKKILSEVFDALNEDQSNPTKTVGIQVDREVPSETSSNICLKDQETNKSVSTDARSITNNIPILGGNMPIIFSGPSTSTPFQFNLSYPMLPMNTPAVASAAAMLPTTSLVSPVVSLPTVPGLTSRESVTTVTTVAKSMDGTLLALTVPKQKIPESQVATNPAVLQPRVQERNETPNVVKRKIPDTQGATNQDVLQQRSRKRKHIAAALIRKCTKISPKPLTSTDNSSSSDTHTDNRFPNIPTPVTSTANDFSSLDNRKNEEQTEQEFKMDIEEGNELAQMKKDQEYFEVMMCNEGSTSDMYIKEETLDPLENNPPSPANTLSSDSVACPVCGARCSCRDELTRHLATTHSRHTPVIIAQDTSKGNYYVT